MFIVRTFTTLVLAALIFGGFTARPAVAQDLPVLERTDPTPIPYEQTMDLSLPESERIQTHLAAVEADLRRAIPDGLNQSQLSERIRLLDHLGEYRRAGVFPVNDYLPELTPVFVDRIGTHCAVGELMRVSGAADLACAIADTTNFATVRELGTRDDVVAWATRVGFTLAECARIQPGYCGLNNDPQDLAVEITGTTAHITWTNPVTYDEIWVSLSVTYPDGTYESYFGSLESGSFEEWTFTELPFGDYEFGLLGSCGGFGTAEAGPLEFSIVPPTLIRGDTNGDGVVNVADVIRTLGYLFTGEAPLDCMEAGDANGDGTVNIADPITVFGHLFFGEAPILAPYPECGEELEPTLSCAVTSTCP